MGGSDGKESAFNAEDPASTPRSGRSPEERNGNPLQLSCLESSVDSDVAEHTWHTHKMESDSPGQLSGALNARLFSSLLTLSSSSLISDVHNMFFYSFLLKHIQ